ncbi:COG4122 Predicted O-methyltransferase [uncultured Caudovirales phage]|uniref:COG4122 Predicted O-methyltransferase n=1 Tax=uncultured Caudovirales phage TaxID=2100421 RepID=A0A6J5QZH8_9CAUD|nr:COG4122 Predicted O-methyltransferase [uncultured Caudovirales phage]
MTDFKFTQDWFHWAPEIWQQLTPTLPGRKRFLELGAFEGRSTAWIVENMLEDDGTLISVDTWEGAEDHVKMELAMPAVENNYDHNLNLLRQQYPQRAVLKFKTTSYEALTKLAGGPQFDFIYIDASHTAPDVLTDACVAWPMLKDKGVMVFDDYLWGEQRDVLHRPKLAVDAFVNIFAEHLKPMHTGYQYIVRKEK